jgi:hypothetical protein
VSIVQVGRIIDTRGITIAVAQQPISIYRVSASTLLLGFLALVGSCPLAAPSHLLRWLHTLAQWVHVNSCRRTSFRCDKIVEEMIIANGVVIREKEHEYWREWPESEHCASRKNHRHKRHHNRGPAAANTHLSCQCVCSAARLQSGVISIGEE